MNVNLMDRQLTSFKNRFGQPHLDLAYHAAFPIALTPDLLYRIWAHFRCDVHRQPLNIPWVAVADVILAPLCNEVGFDLYEIETDLRKTLLAQLKADPRFGQSRLQELANFLLTYHQESQLYSNDLDLRDLAEAQRWNALAQIQPKQVMRDLAQILVNIPTCDGAEWGRMAALMTRLQLSYGDSQTLLHYARGMANLAQGDVQASLSYFRLLPGRGRQRTKVAGVMLSMPNEIQRRAQPATSVIRSMPHDAFKAISAKLPKIHRSQLVGAVIIILLVLTGLLSIQFLGLMRIGLSLSLINDSSPPRQTVSAMKTLPGHRGSIDAMLLLAGGDLLLTGSADATIRLWNLTNRAQIAQFEGHTSFVKDLELSADQTRLFSAGADRQIIVWDLASRRVLDAIPEAHDTIINAIDVSPDGRTLVSASAGGDIKLWDVASGELTGTLDGDDGPINDVIFDHSGRRIASVGQSLRLWDAKTGTLIKEISKSSGFINGVVIDSANQILLSVAADGMVHVWDLDTGDLIASKAGHDGPVNELIINRDGQTFLTAGADRTVRLWDMSTYEQTLVMAGFDSDVYRFQVRFAADQIITVGGEDHTVKVWQAPNL